MTTITNTVASQFTNKSDGANPFGSQIRKFRKTAKMTQAALSQALATQGVQNHDSDKPYSVPFICDIENGNRRASLDIMMGLIAVFKIREKANIIGRWSLHFTGITGNEKTDYDALGKPICDTLGIKPPRAPRKPKK